LLQRQGDYTQLHWAEQEIDAACSLVAGIPLPVIMEIRFRLTHQRQIGIGDFVSHAQME
jgi:hypothetical protein